MVNVVSTADSIIVVELGEVTFSRIAIVNKLRIHQKTHDNLSLPHLLKILRKRLLTIAQPTTENVKIEILLVSYL